MLKRVGLLVVVAVIGLSGKTQAGPRTDGATSELRQQVLDWLDATNDFEFQGTIEFTKRMKLPADPSRVEGIDQARAEIDRCERKYAMQLVAIAGLEGGDAQELRMRTVANRERAIAQYEEMLRYYEKWATTGIEVEQRWQVIFLSSEDMRVKFVSESVDPKLTSLLPIARVGARTYGEAWGRNSLLPTNNGVPSGVESAPNQDLLRQAQQEIAFLLRADLSELSPDALSELMQEGNSVSASFVGAPRMDRADVGTTWVRLNRDPSGRLVLESMETVTPTEYVRRTYGEFRDLGTTVVPFEATLELGPVSDLRLPASDRAESMVSEYVIIKLDAGLTQDDVDLLVEPAEADPDAVTPAEAAPSR